MLLTTAQFAAKIGIKPRQVRKLIDNGTIPAKHVRRLSERLLLVDDAALPAARGRRTKPGRVPKAAHRP